MLTNAIFTRTICTSTGDEQAFLQQQIANHSKFDSGGESYAGSIFYDFSGQRNQALRLQRSTQGNQSSGASRRKAGHHRAQRLRQEHADTPDERPGGGHQRARIHRRTRHDPSSPRQAEPGIFLHGVSAVQSLSPHDRAGKPDSGSHEAQGRFQRRRREMRHGEPEAGRSGGEGQRLSHHPFRRPAAAHRHCPGADHEKLHRLL